MMTRSKGRIGRNTYVYWKESGVWLGYPTQYADYMTQGDTLGELRENLRDICCVRGIVRKRRG